MTKTKKCATCRTEFEYEPHFLASDREIVSPETCSVCAEIERKKLFDEEEKRQRFYRAESWKAMCPPLYQETEVARLPKQTQKVIAWEYNPKGLMIAGDTGKGKTRAAFLLMKKIHMQGLSVEIFHGNSFAHQCAINFGEMNGEKWIAEIARRKVVFFDDLGKFKLTERVEAELFGLIEIRMAHKRPIIATTNMTGDALKDKMTGDRGEPLVRRLRECCEIIVL